MPSITLPMVLGATVVGGVATAALSSSASHDAAKTQAAAADQAATTQAAASDRVAANQMQMYQTTRSDLAPYLQTGQGALAQLSKLWGLNPGGSGMPDSAAMTQALEATPGYTFGRDQGLKALDRSAASKGMLLSGGQLQDAQTFGNNYATANAWQPYVTQLGALASLGENAGAQVGNAGTAAANGAGTAITQGASGVAASQLAAGQAAAAGTVGSANAWTSGINNALSNATLAYQLQQGGGAPSGYGIGNTPYWNI